jgi:hypothetical protein
VQLNVLQPRTAAQGDVLQEQQQPPSDVTGMKKHRQIFAFETGKATLCCQQGHQQQQQQQRSAHQSFQQLHPAPIMSTILHCLQQHPGQPYSQQTANSTSLQTALCLQLVLRPTCIAGMVSLSEVNM